MRLRDESSWVRQVTLDLLGRLLEDMLARRSFIPMDPLPFWSGQGKEESVFDSWWCWTMETASTCDDCVTETQLKANNGQQDTLTGQAKDEAGRLMRWYEQERVSPI
eukprot:1426641-Amphidinium_carterae.1